MSETMQTLTRKSACVMLSLLLLLSAVLPVKAAAETASAKVVRVGSFEDTFNYVNEKGARKGYGYELLETLSGYTGWQFEYVTCDWSDCFEKLKNGEIDIIGGISYTEDRTQEMLFSDEPMGVEKYYLYADLSRADISASDFKTLNGKKIGVLMGTEPEVMLAEWEEKYGLKTEHVNISNNEDVKQKLANHEIDCFVSLEESFWAERGISTITRVGESGIYYAINKTGLISRKNLTMRCARWTKLCLFIRRICTKDISQWIIRPSLQGRKRRGSESTVRSGWAFWRATAASAPLTLPPGSLPG